jgi:parallel beta-helix repeat protein
MKRKLLFYYTNSKSVFLTLFSLFLFTCAQAQINIAPQATPSAGPGCSTGPCSTLNDLNFGNCGNQQMWISCNATNPGPSVHITFVWPSIKSIKGMTIHVGEMNNRFLTGGTIQQWDASNAAWVTVMTFTQSNLGVCNYKIDFPSVISTTQLRIIDLTVGGSQSSNCNFREIEIWQGSTSNYDIGVASIDSPVTFCSGPQNVYARVINFGKNQINGFTVNWSLDGVLQTPVNSSANLDTAGGTNPDNALVMLGTHTFTPHVLTRLKAWTSMPSGVADTSVINDTTAVWEIPGLTGNYTIGGVGASFPDVVTAALALRTGGVCGPVVFTVNPGTYTGQVDLKSIPGVSATNTITFEGVDKNTCIVSFAASTLGGDYPVITIDNTPYITLRNLSVINTGTTAGFGIVIQNGSHYTKIKNCIVSVFDGTSSAFSGIVVSGSRTSPTTATRADYVEVDSCRINGYYAFASYAASGSNINVGLKFTNNTVSYNYYGVYLYYNSTIKIENNTISGSLLTQTGYGIYMSQLNTGGSTPNAIVRNKVSNIGYYGIYVSTGANTIGNKGVIANNFIGGSGSPTTYNGLYISTGSNWMIKHNTILYGLASPTLSYGPVYFSGGSGNSVINNIFHSKSIGATFYGSAVSAFDTLDYNTYSRTSKGANYFYLAAYYTDSTFKTVGGFNTNALTTDPGFKNDTVLLTTQPCLTGIPTSVPEDYYGVTRNPSAPTLGAAEYVRYADEMMIVAVKKPVAPVTSGYQDVEIIVRNSGTTTLNNFVVNYTDNGGFPVSVYWNGTLAPCDTTTVLFTGGSQLNLTSSHDLAFFTSLPNFVNDPNPANDTIRMMITLPLNGNYVVGSLPSDFATPQAAVAALKNSGMTGPVTFTVKPGTYTGQLRVEGPFPGNSSANTITFDGVDASTRIIDASISQPAVLMTGVSYITFKNFTVNNASSAAGTGGIALVGSFIDNTGTGSTIKNNIVNLPNVGSNTSYGINITGANNGTAQANNNMDTLVVDSNTINGGYYGISFYGNTGGSSNYNRLAKIRGNNLNNIYYMGAYVYYIYNPVEFTRNTIVMDTTYTGTTYGLYFYYCLNTTTLPHKVSGNKVVNANYMGLYLYNFASPSASPMQVYNNIVTGKSRYTTYYPIYTYGTANGNINCYHNTVLAQNTAATAPTIYGIYYSNTATVRNYKNNIIGILTTNASPTSVPLYLGNAVTGNSVNYNTYYNLSSSNMVYYNTSYYNTSNYNVANIGGDNSVNNNPNFSNILSPSLTEGCLRGVNLNADVPADYNGLTRSASPNLGALEFVGPSNDLSMEAMLYPVVPVASGAQDLAVRIRNNGSNVISSFNVAYTNNNGTPVVYNWTGTLNPCGTTNVVFNGANQITIGGSNSIKVYSYLPNGVADVYPANDSISVVLSTPLNGPYTVGPAPSDFVSLTAAVDALKSRGISGPVRFNIKTGTYNESLNLDQVNGASATNTITFTSMASHVDSVNLSWSSTGISPFVIRFNTFAKYYIFDRITIAQLNNAGAYSNIQLLGSASFDTIRNCKINSPAYLSNATYNIYATPFNGESINIDGNEINGAYYGIYLNGASRATGFKNVVVNGNTFNNFYYSPMYYFQYSRSSAVTNNTFNTPPTSSTGIYSYFYYNDSGFKNMGNVFNTLSGKTVYWYNYYSNNSSAKKSFIANNQINGTGNVYFYVGNTATNNQEIVHNTFNLNGGYMYITGATSSMRIMNNVLTGTSYPYYYNGTPSSAMLTSDYNMVYTTGTTPYYAAAGARTASYFKSTYAPLESKSVYARAGLTGTVPNVLDTDCWSMNGTGTFLGYALNDYAGTPRSQTMVQGAPDLGAFEFTPGASTLPPVLTAVPATPAAGTTQAFLSGMDTVAKITWDAFTIPPASITGRLYTGAYPPGLSGVTHKSLNMYWGFDVPAGFYNYTISLYFRPTMRGSIETAADMIGTKKSGTNPWTHYYAPQSTVDSVAGILTISNLYDFSLFTGTDLYNPLPVTLSRFGATAQRSNVLVSWTTASEKNVSHFEVYASADGRTYKAISSRIRAKGNSNVSASYSFTDVNALANASVVYYKLKSTDSDGSFEWSDVAIVRSGKNNSTTGFAIYPNPFSNSLSLDVPEAGATEVVITSLQGELLSEQTVAADGGKVTLNNLGTLKPGIYFIKITQNGISYTEKLVKE